MKNLLVIFCFICFLPRESLCDWQKVDLPLEGYRLNKSFFIDDSTGWVVGSGGSIFKTTDGGSTWLVEQYQNYRYPCNLFDVWFTDKNNGIAVGYYAQLITTNGGDYWDFLSDNANFHVGQPKAVYYWDANNIIIAGGEGKYIKTTNGGKSWSSYETDS